MPRHATRTSFVKGDIRLLGKKQKKEHIEKRIMPLRKDLMKTKCSSCGNKVERNEYEMINRRWHFCNRRCYAKWVRTERTKLCGYKLTNTGRKILEKIWKNNGKESAKRWAKKTIKQKEQWIIEMRKAQEVRPTNPEKIMREIIFKNNLPYRYTGDGKFWITNINPDFVNTNGQKIVIEVFGNYWHNLLNIKIMDRKKKKILKKWGWKRIIIWEKELYKNKRDKIVSKIREVQDAIR